MSASSNTGILHWFSSGKTRMFPNLRRDAARCERWYTDTGFWIVAVYRFGMWVSTLQNALLRIPLWAVYRLLRLPNNLLRVHLWAGPQGAKIGPGFRLIHPTNVMIGPGVEIGENCLVFHDVTLGRGQTPGTPKIGSNVDIYCGARILGGVSVGDGCMIGANCVVTRDIPAGSVVVTAPARIMPKSLSPLSRRANTEEENT